MNGIYNAVGPKPATVKEIAEGIAKAQDKQALIMPVPEIALRLAMGEMADMVLFSTPVSAAKIEKTGFRFEHPELVPAIRDLLERQI